MSEFDRGEIRLISALETPISVVIQSNDITISKWSIDLE